MTIRELAETAGCNEKTVRRIVSEKMPGKIVNGKVTRFTWDEAHKVMGWLPKRNLVQMSEVPSQNVQASTLTQRDLELISSIVAMTIQKLDQRVTAIETRVESRQALLPGPQIKPRDNVNKIVREYAERESVPFSTAWGELYREFGYRTNTAPKVSAKNRGMGILDYIEAEGMIETLEAVAVDVFVRG